MKAWTPRTVWIVATSASAVVHLTALVAGGAAWAERSTWQEQTLPLLSHRDITFLVGHVAETVEAARAEAAAPGEAKPAVPAGPRESTVALPPRSKADAAPAAPKPPPLPKPVTARVPEPSPVPKPDPAREDPPAAIDAGLVEALDAMGAAVTPELEAPRDRYFYMQRLRQRIARNCAFLLTQQAASARGLVVFDVVIHRGGTLREIRYRQHSDYPALDILAEQALLRSAPFQPFYQAMDMQYCSFVIPIRFGPAASRSGRE
jgi:outer membrane biosynthesis protein TonB